MNTEITEYKKVSGWVFYDGECRYCRALARRFGRLLNGRHFELLPLQTPGSAERLHVSKAELLTEMRLLRPDGECFGGADALLEIARDFWWAWPLRLLGRIGPIRHIFHIGYRWVARNRSCTAGTCEIKGSDSNRKIRAVDLLPLLAVPLLALLLKAHVAPWVFMWAMAFALYFGCKWLTYRRAVCGGLRPKIGRTLAYLLAWPGMDAADFLDARKLPMNRVRSAAVSETSRSAQQRSRALRLVPLCPHTAALRVPVGSCAVSNRGKSRDLSTKPQTWEWVFAIVKTVTGIVMVWVLARSLLPAYPILAGWAGMIGVVFILHFGLFHLLALFWQWRGIAATPVMQNPVFATSLAEFWGQRWNTAFNELAFRFAYRPIRRITAPATATLLVFGLSGLIHDLLISLPAGGGYGLPTLYFLIQGLGTIIERSRFGRSIGLGRGTRGWLFTLFVTVGPVAWLFHPQFIKHVILPMLNAIGAT